MFIKDCVVRQYVGEDLHEFTEMFTRYFIDDFKIEMSLEKLEKLCKDISMDVLGDIIKLDILFIEGKYTGFIIYQVDSKKSDWCEKEGWGFIREVHVNKAYRGHNLGQVLVKHAEDRLLKLGVLGIYLTSDEAKKFWLSCDYEPTGEHSKINKDPIYIKQSPCNM